MDDRTLTAPDDGGPADVSADDKAIDANDVQVDGDGGCGPSPCCAAISNDVKNCGACGHDCTAASHIGSPADVSCSAGKCILLGSACAQGYADCNADPDDGCEADLSLPSHCGACTNPCGTDAPLCSPAGCAATCPAAASTRCGTSCVDTASDPKHCGDCATECSRPVRGGVATCQLGTCGVKCQTNFHSCAGTAECQSDDDPAHCGPNCTACPIPANGGATCTNGTCAKACNNGYVLCGDSCVDATRDVKNCGACGHDCNALAHIASTAGITCSAGACVVPSSACAPGFAHCTANSNDGCETDITTSLRCQDCTTQCPSNLPICSTSGCMSSCPAATPTMCGSSCVDIDSDSKHCGACNQACTQPAAGGNATCEQRVCTLHCLPGFHPCGTTQCASDGDATQCEGPACHACAGTPNGNPQCAGNACTVSCSAGFHLCRGVCAIDTDPMNCGATCAQCSGPASMHGAPSCSGGQCSVTCEQGYHACSGNCFINTDPAHCGDPACSICPGPNAQCSSGVCTIANPILTLPGLQFYVDRLLAPPALTGVSVTGWLDLSGQNNHLDTVSPTRPTWIAGAGVQFTASANTFLARLSTNLIGTGLDGNADAYTFGIVMRFDGVNGLDQSFFCNNNTNVGGFSISYSDVGTCWQIQHVNSANGLQQDGPFAAGTFYVLTVRRPAGGLDDFRVNDAMRALNPPDNAPLNPSGANGPATLIMGARGNTSGAADQFGSATIAAAFVCHADAGLANISNVVAYWRSKYGI